MLPLYGARGLADFPQAFPTELVVRAASEWLGSMECWLWSRLGMRE